MTTEGGDHVQKTVRTMRKRKPSLHVLKSSDDENSELSEEGSSEDEWRYTRKKKTSQRRRKPRPTRTLKKSLAEKAKKLQSEFNETVLIRPSSPDIRPSSVDTNSDNPKPDTTTLESSRQSSETDEKKSNPTSLSDVVTEMISGSCSPLTNEVDQTSPILSSSLAAADRLSIRDVPMKCDSSIKTELVDTNVVKVKHETDPVEVESTIIKSVKPDKDSDADADTVILLSDDDDDDDDVPNDSNTVVLNCNILHSFASPILTGNENPAETRSTVSPAMPTIRVRPLEQMTSNSPPSVLEASVSPAIPSPRITYSPVLQQPVPDSPYPSTLSAHLASTSPSIFPSPVLTSPRMRGTRSSARGSRQSSRGRSARARASPDVRCLTPRSRRPSYNYSPRTRGTASPRLDSISLSNISPGGTVIRNGLDSITVTPTKKSPAERPPTQRRLFKSEVEGVITARESGYVVSLANGTHFPLSLVQVEKLREQNNGVLPNKLRIPVPSDVAATIETRIVIDE